MHINQSQLLYKQGPVLQCSQVKSLAEMPGSHVSASLSPTRSTSDSVPRKCAWGSSRCRPKCQTAGTNMRDLEGVPGPAQAITASAEQTSGSTIAPSLPFSNSAFQFIKKKLKNPITAYTNNSLLPTSFGSILTIHFLVTQNTKN